MGVLSKLKMSWFGASGYEAAVSSKRRKTAVVNLRREDDLLRPRERDVVVSQARSLRRNSSIAAWAVRKHLDYVATHTLQVRSGDEQLDVEIERFLDRWMRPGGVDVTGRFSFDKLIRLAEELAMTDGDVLIAKLSDGRVQIIEGDRVRTPTDWGNVPVEQRGGDWVHGVRVTPTGRPTAYAVCDREGSGYKLKSILPAQYVVHYGHWDRYDQVRGVSPIAAAINQFLDTHEAQEYALAKLKLSQLFGVKLRRAEGVEGDDGGDFTFDFNAGPQVVDLSPGDDVDVMESKNPSVEFQAFMEKAISFALRSLDIPYSFFDESHTNYSGARQALLMYEQSAAAKRERVVALRENLISWRLGLAIEDGDIDLRGKDLNEASLVHLATGLPWIDPLKEVNAEIAAVNAGLKSRADVCLAHGRDWYEVADQLAAEKAYMDKLGLDRGVAAPAAVPDDDEDDEGDDDE